MSPLHFLISAWEAMTYRYISDVMDGARRMLHTLPDNVRKTEYRRQALSPGGPRATPLEIPDGVVDGTPYRLMAVDFHPQNGGTNLEICLESRPSPTSEILTHFWRNTPTGSS